MRLVEFDHNKKKKVFVNPESVRSVIKHGDDKTMIFHQSAMTIVLHDVDYVVRKLTEEVV